MWTYICLSCFMVLLALPENVSAQIGTTSRPPIHRFKRQTQGIGNSSVGNVNNNGTSAGNIFGPSNTLNVDSDSGSSNLSQAEQTIGDSSIGNITSNGSATNNQFGPKNEITQQQGTSGCTLPEQPNHGSYQLSNCTTYCNKVAGQNVPDGTVLRYTCTFGHTLNGNSQIECRDDSWSGTSTCESILRRIPIIGNAFN